MIYLVMLVKAIAWLTAFWLGTRGGLRFMLASAAGIAVLLTFIDHLAVVSGVLPLAVVLSLLLYTTMSFLLFPLAWKLKDPAVSLACSVMGTLGAFAVVNFTMEFLRGQLPL